MSNFNIGALRQLPPATFFADFRNGYTNEMVRLNTTRSTTVSTRVNNSGLIETVGANIPRLDYDPLTKAVKGLLVEPAAENKCKQSEDINTTWSPVNATPTQSTQETPDGDTTNKYIKLRDDNGGGTGIVRVEQTVTGLTGGAKYTASVFLKKDGVNWARLEAVGTGSAGSTSPDQFFDLDNGVLGSGNAGIDDATIEEYPNDWYRCSFSWTQGAGNTAFTFRIWLAEADNDNQVDLDTTSSIFVWGVQVEEGPIATSYIPTTTGGVTRNKDDISISSASGLIGQTEGTLYVEVDWRLTTGAAQVLLVASDGTTNNRIRIYKDTSTPNQLRMYARADADTKTDQGVDSSGFSGIQKIAFAYKTDDFELYRNGSSISSDTDGSLSALATLTDIDIGQSFAATLQANMHIRSVALFKKRLTDQQLQALTGN